MRIALASWATSSARNAGSIRLGQFTEEQQNAMINALRSRLLITPALTANVQPDDAPAGAGSGGDDLGGRLPLSYAFIGRGRCRR